LFATQDGSPEFSSPDNALLQGNLNTTLVPQGGVSNGAATITLTVTAGVGSGMIVLEDGETGTITITRRVSVTQSRPRLPNLRTRR
jgi:hypothetical protein